MFSQTFYHELSIFLHEYIRHIGDISQIWSGPCCAESFTAFWMYWIILSDTISIHYLNNFLDLAVWFVNKEQQYRVINSNRIFSYLFDRHLKQRLGKTQPYLLSLHIDILIFWCRIMVRWRKKSCLSGLCQNIITAPYCRDWEPRYPQTHPSASNFNEYHSDNPKHPRDIPQTSPWRLQGAGDAKRWQQTPTDTGRCT